MTVSRVSTSCTRTTCLIKNKTSTSHASKLAVVTSGIFVMLLIRLAKAWTLGCCFETERGIWHYTHRAGGTQHSRIRLSRPSSCTSMRASTTKQDEEQQIIETDLKSMPDGIPDGFKVIRQYRLPDRFDWSMTNMNLTAHDIERLELTPSNVSLPVALQIADTENYPSFSRARKACRKGNILLCRGDTAESESNNAFVNKTNQLDIDRCARGKVADRCYPGDIICYQVRMGSGYFPILHYKQPSFNISVLYEDDHFALVNKPAGVVVYNQKNGGHGTNTVRAALPFILQPPATGTFAVLRRPASVHRLDKPTSGILCVAKTKPAMLDLSRQFHDRIVQKTYMAVINGIPHEDNARSISSQDAYDRGVDVDPMDSGTWQMIDSPLEGQHAVTIWRAVRYARSLHAYDGYLTLVEVKPKTGRYHQIRRHFAWETNRPLVGDDQYDGNSEIARKFRDNGLFLASTRIKLEHPFYRNELASSLDIKSNLHKFPFATFKAGNSGEVRMSAAIDIPEKFIKLLKREEERYDKFNESS